MLQLLDCISAQRGKGCAKHRSHSAAQVLPQLRAKGGGRMSHNAAWTEAEDRALRSHYPTHGPSWEGWAEILPRRSEKAIRVRATRLGLTRTARAARGGRPRRNPYDAAVMGGMSAGMTPREIDRARHWAPGTAARVLMGLWAKGERVGTTEEA